MPCAALRDATLGDHPAHMASPACATGRVHSRLEAALAQTESDNKQLRLRIAGLEKRLSQLGGGGDGDGEAAWDGGVISHAGGPAASRDELWERRLWLATSDSTNNAGGRSRNGGPTGQHDGRATDAGSTPGSVPCAVLMHWPLRSQRCWPWSSGWRPRPLRSKTPSGSSARSRWPRCVDRAGLGRVG